MRVCMLSCFTRVQLFVSPWTVACQVPLSMRFSRQEHWSGLPFLSPGNLPDPGIELGSLALQADSLPSEPPGKPEFLYSKVKFLRAIQLQAWRGEIYQSKLGLLGRENWNKPSKWIDFWILHVIEPKEEIHLVHNRKCEQYQSDQYIGLVWHFGWAVYRRCVFSSWSESADVS